MMLFQNKNTLRSDVQSVIRIKYFGVAFSFIAISLIATPIYSLLLFLPFMLPFLFGITVAEIRITNSTIQYRHYFFPWRTIKHTDIIKAGKFWVYGYIKLSKPVMPWGRLYFIDADKMPFRRWPILHYLEGIVNHNNTDIADYHINEKNDHTYHPLLRLPAFIIGMAAPLLPALSAPDIYYYNHNFIMIHPITIRYFMLILYFPARWPWSLATIIITILWEKHKNTMNTMLFSLISGICTNYIIIYAVLWKIFNIKI